MYTHTALRCHPACKIRERYDLLTFRRIVRMCSAVPVHIPDYSRRLLQAIVYNTADKTIEYLGSINNGHKDEYFFCLKRNVIKNQHTKLTLKYYESYRFKMTNMTN